MASKRGQASRQIPDPERSVQDEWFDANIRHQIGILRYARKTSNDYIRILDATEADIRQKIRDRLQGNESFDRPASVRRLDTLLAEIEAIRTTAHIEAAAIWIEALQALLKREPAFIAGMLQTVVPVQLNPTLPDAGRLRAIVNHTPFQGKVMKKWAAKIREDDLERIADQVRIGVTQGESIPQISRRVVGTASLKGGDGVTAITRRNAEAITRTVTNGIANEAASVFAKDNDDIFDGELYVATLDGVTTRDCSRLDGKRFKIGEGPHPPRHYNCRSRRVPLLDPEPLGERPFKAVHQKQLLREFAKENDIRPVPRLRSELPRGTKGKFDEFARHRTRDFIGRVPAKTDYDTFLRRQRAEFQDDVLGKTKGRLFRRGKLSIDKFADSEGVEKTLQQLARDERDAFIAAGLDPERFL
jgi:SPP1 gp7 family putative phage head morphogenesis protein